MQTFRSGGNLGLRWKSKATSVKDGVNENTTVPAVCYAAFYTDTWKIFTAVLKAWLQFKSFSSRIADSSINHHNQDDLDVERTCLKQQQDHTEQKHHCFWSSASHHHTYSQKSGEGWGKSVKLDAERKVNDQSSDVNSYFP